MKLQGFSIIFGLLMLPIILVLSYYLQLQVKTITLQSAYDSKLLDATYDAVQAFEINTANEDLSSVADSLRSIIEASNNVFFNTLATNMGLSNASKSRMQVFVPAILYTLYDGYYIYSPTEVPEVLSDNNGQAIVIDEEEKDPSDPNPDSHLSTPGLTYSGGFYRYDPTSNTKQTITDSTPPPEDYGLILYRLCDSTTKIPVDLYTTDINYGLDGGPYQVYYKTDYVLKSYMPYAAKYNTTDPDYGTIDLTISYTLDNYLTVEGNIGDVYYTKSGYYIDEDSVEVDTTSSRIKIDQYNQNEAGEVIQAIKAVKTDDNPDNNNSMGNIRITVAVPGSTEPLVIDTGDAHMSAMESEYNSNIGTKMKIDQLYSVLEYYCEAKIFSHWCNQYLRSIKGSDIVENTSSSLVATEPAGVVPLETQTTNEYIYTFSEFDDDGNLEDGYNIFTNLNDPEGDAAFFQSHKRKVMRNMIQYNLNLAMSVYSASTTAAYSYQMPVLTERDWETITTRLTVVSFMQGLKAGLKVYNGYACAYSTNNELTVIPDEIFYINKDHFDNGILLDDLNIVPENLYYHRDNCPDLLKGPSINPDDPTSFTSLELIDPHDIISFTSKEVKYDKIYDKYENTYQYDHRNLACYRCIVDSNYNRIWNRFRTSTDAAVQDFYNRKMNNAALIRAVGVAKERNDIYKSYNINVDEGFDIIYRKNQDGSENSKDSSRPLSEVKRIEVVFDIVPTNMLTDRTVYFTINGLPIQAGKETFSLNLNQTKEQSISIPIEPTNNRTVRVITSDIKDPNKIQVFNDLVDDHSDNVNDHFNVKLFNAVRYIKVIYK